MRIYRLYRAEGLAVRRLKRKRLSRVAAVTHVVRSNQEWALGDSPGVQDLLEYETRVNYFLPKYDDMVVCTFDLTKFSGSVVMDILRTHPMAIIGGILQENPFFVPPDEFLREIRERDAPTARS